MNTKYFNGTENEVKLLYSKLLGVSEDIEYSDWLKICGALINYLGRDLAEEMINARWKDNDESIHAIPYDQIGIGTFHHLVKKWQVKK